MKRCISMSAKRNSIIMSLFIIIPLFNACQEDYTPKPRSYFHIELQEKTYIPLKIASPFSFEIPSMATIIPKMNPDKTDNWFDIYYPSYNARIYCSYKTIKQEEFRKISEDNYRFVYQHTIKADAIEGDFFAHPEKRIYGILYTLMGNTATPIQFVATDSTTHFFRASLYFDCIPNQDSLQPVINYIKDDIKHIINTLEWKTSNLN